MKSARTLAAPVLAAVASLSACSGTGHAAAKPEPAPEVATAPAPVSVDLDKLRLGGPGDRVLVQARGKPFIRAAEYDAWLGSYPLNITKSDARAAQAEAVDQMVSYRLLLERAVAAGYESKSGSSSDAPSIVLRYVTDHIRNSASISDDQARRYHDEHLGELSGLDTPEVPQELRLAAWKGAVRGAQLAKALEEQRKDAQVEILLAELRSPERNEQ